MLKINAAVGLMIARCRESLGLTQSEAARRCQLDLDVYQQIERGQENFDIMILEKIAVGLGPVSYTHLGLDHYRDRGLAHSSAHGWNELQAAGALCLRGRDLFDAQYRIYRGIRYAGK